MKHYVGISYPYKKDISSIWNVIFWCREKFGPESKKSYPIPSPPHSTHPRWQFQSGLLGGGPGFSFKFRYEKDAILFKMTWL